jgi:ribonucleotide reductase alpha subunit
VDRVPTRYLGQDSSCFLSNLVDDKDSITQGNRHVIVTDRAVGIGINDPTVDNSRVRLTMQTDEFRKGERSISTKRSDEQIPTRKWQISRQEKHTTNTTQVVRRNLNRLMSEIYKYYLCCTDVWGG